MPNINPFDLTCEKAVELLFPEEVVSAKNAFKRFAQYLLPFLEEKIKRRQARYIDFQFEDEDFYENVKHKANYIRNNFEEVFNFSKFFSQTFYPVFIYNHWVLVSEQSVFVKATGNTEYIPVNEQQKRIKINKYLDLIDFPNPSLMVKLVKIIGLYLRGTKTYLPYILRVYVDEIFFKVEFYTIKEKHIFSVCGWVNDFHMLKSALEYLTSLAGIKSVYFEDFDKNKIDERIIKIYTKNVALGVEKLYDLTEFENLYTIYNGIRENV